MDKMEVGERIRELREARGMTQNALANAAGVSPTYIYQLERGEKSPTVEYLDHICWGLGVTIKDFFGESELNGEIAAIFSELNERQRHLLAELIKSLRQ